MNRNAANVTDIYDRQITVVDGNGNDLTTGAQIKTYLRPSDNTSYFYLPTVAKVVITINVYAETLTSISIYSSENRQISYRIDLTVSNITTFFDNEMVGAVKGINKGNVTSVRITFTNIDTTLPIKISVLGCFKGEPGTTPSPPTTTTQKPTTTTTPTITFPTSTEFETTTTKTTPTTTTTYSTTITTINVCIVNVSQLGLIPDDDTNIIGYIEKDNVPPVPSFTSYDEAVMDGDFITENVTLHIKCKKCTCQYDGTIDCVPDEPCECTYTPWSAWGGCSVTCGNGWRYRSQALLSGHPLCASRKDEDDPCYAGECITTTTQCPPWGSWSPCDCNTNRRTRSRTGCEENSEEEACFDCSTTPTTCPPGRYPDSCANPCHESCQEYRKPGTCIDPEGCSFGCVCPQGMRLFNNQCINETDCPCYDDDGTPVLQGYSKKNSPRCTECICEADKQFHCYPSPGCCEWSQWNTWSTCSKTCEAGIQYRTRTILGGDSCDPTDGSETRPCLERDKCPDCIIDGVEYESNEVISNCTCEICFCRGEGEKVCLPKEDENVDGGLSDWSEWSLCTKNCKGGHRTRTRECNNPPPRCAGQICPGTTLATEPCNEDVSCCEVDDWSDWGPCDQDCGPGGFKNRTRNYILYADFLSGCNRTLMEITPCTDNLPCNINCNVSEWTSWSSCDVACGVGRERRSRTADTSIAGCEAVELAEERPCFSQNCVCAAPYVWKNDSLCHQQTCSDMSVPADCSEQLLADCVCPEGMYKKNGKCVEINRCYQCEVGGEIINNGGLWYPEGTCDICQCVNGEVKCRPNMEIPICLEGEEITYDDGPCCPKCKPKKDTCQLKNKTAVLNYGANCVTEEITFQYCSGSCGISSSAPSVILSENGAPVMVDDCKCCGGIPSGQMMTVALTCNTAGTVEQLQGFLPMLSGCKCSQCA